VQYVRIVGKIAEVLFNLTKVLGGNWSAIVTLVMSVIDLHAAWRRLKVPRASRLREREHNVTRLPHRERTVSFSPQSPILATLDPSITSTSPPSLGY
jgi:hypothetical protein